MNEKQTTFQKQMTAEMEQCGTKIEEVKSKAQQAKARAKLKYYDQLEDLRIKERGARLKLAECEQAAEGKDWEVLREEVETAVQNLKDGLKEAGKE